MTGSEIMRLEGSSLLMSADIPGLSLEVLAEKHVEPLLRVGTDPLLWEWTSVRCTTEPALRAYLASAMRDHATGEALPLATVYRGEVVGTTRFAAIASNHKRCEIGWTFVKRDLWGSGVNTAVKWLMLRHAFDISGMNRVEFKTDLRNERSRRALASIGAKEEGILRKHMVCDDGHVRDSVYFSVIQQEWPAVSIRLLEKARGKGL